ncbi:Nif11-like leader peptide family natural product precursor [Cyanobium sp. HWJ4-Hawea]|uniref:Nif11-like leader peptide family natural product precursor n=1 Tax=Cyanobium sp. HWJ4-Hawea TaxID=2823713 RepID=UPI0020CE37CA|nr:Nif11-like leader peptide family natural product precursor [Cyanobium sp. HWJ4-Hawea]MCP9809643.1 Nif11-like leader peptide family natural product precursor [Cyanobium sp. HWJ4-Hawea]
MSVASIKAFVDRVSGDEALRSKLHAATGVDDIVAIAADHGHDLNKTVLLREHARAIVDAHDHELSGINSWGDALMHAFGATDKD